ncbi:MAG TPA: gamma carbonic anhydrase family protein [Bacteroidota bacterium]
MSLISYGQKSPKIHSSVFIAEGAIVIGDVLISPHASVWYQSVLRGDINSVQIGERTNVQDGCVLHVTQNHPVIVGDDVTIGHRTIVHGCKIGDCALIGMGAIVLDGAVVGKNALIAAGAVVKEGFTVPERTLVAGIPARIMRELTNKEVEHIRQSAVHYVDYAAQFMNHSARE